MEQINDELALLSLVSHFTCAMSLLRSRSRQGLLEYRLYCSQYNAFCFAHTGGHCPRCLLRWFFGANCRQGGNLCSFLRFLLIGDKSKIMQQGKARTTIFKLHGSVLGVFTVKNAQYFTWSVVYHILVIENSSFFNALNHTTPVTP